MENRPKDLNSKSLADLGKRPQVFDAEAIGQSLRELGADVIRGETTDFLSRWWHSSVSDADLVIWTDSENRVIKYQLCFYGQVVEWNPIHGTRTGFIFEEETVNGASESEVTETVKFDAELQEGFVNQAIEVFAQVSGINDEERYKLIFNLRESPKMHKNTRERALKVWAHKIDEIVTDRRPNFWQRLRGWVLGNG